MPYLDTVFKLYSINICVLAMESNYCGNFYIIRTQNSYCISSKDSLFLLLSQQMHELGVCCYNILLLQLSNSGMY